MTTKKLLAASAFGVLVMIPIAGCSTGGDSGTETISWWTWDDKQAVSYAACETAFEDANPAIDVEIKQYVWDDYWAKITAGFVGGNAPDTFMNHPSYYPEFADQGQLLPLEDRIDESGFDLDRYAIGLTTWGEYKDGSVYGLPKDWSTMAFFYDQDLLAEAGLTAEDVATMTWNPEDGGTFEDVIARLTVDTNGVRGDEAGFDADSVAVYGMSTLTGGGINGQDTWAQFAPTTGWELGDAENWPTTFQYEDDDYVATAEWIRSLVAKGYTPDFEEFTTGIAEQLGSGSVAMVQSGSWNLNTFAALDGVNVGSAPSVVGPIGERRALSGSNADVIWAGTEHEDAAWEWISYLGTEECQTLAGADGTFFPSIAEAMTATTEAFAEQGIDTSAFTVQFEDGTLYESPLFSGGTEVQSTVSSMSELFWTGERDSDVFAEMDEASAAIFAEHAD
ncbi:ABC transporter substrate-binding protein [Arenivirga flava]|uniref:Sugar ABC transporter substrate-binding protein n=1 Tax=Arenivirga flava TaxID=1930060 RepID=A0AA37XBP3_9MICO|nr:sugar ABC transporter substrate-binding protein [Arenivirga flava]GMA28560.1 sugar ABC transporter substrate-binding protein [Arenivirga flava]